MTEAERPLVVWLVEDSAIFRRAAAEVLAAEPGFRLELAAASVEEMLSAVDAGLAPDAVLLDIGLPGLDGIEGARRLRALRPQARVVMLTVHEEDAAVFEAICAGASGYLLKPLPVERLVAAVREVAAGSAPINGAIAKRILDRFSSLPPPPAGGDAYGLSAREREILAALVRGLTLRECAAELAISPHTVDTHVRHLYEKLQVRSRGGAVAKAVRERIV